MTIIVDRGRSGLIRTEEGGYDFTLLATLFVAPPLVQPELTGVI